jgi:hypothetical protein
MQSIGFRAFDGSNKYYKRLALYDLDCCFQPNGRRVNPGISDPDDGYYVVERVGCICCARCVVVDSVRWYAANGFAVGSVIPCPSPQRGVVRTATRVLIEFNSICCNSNATSVYWELSEEITDNPLP